MPCSSLAISREWTRGAGAGGGSLPLAEDPKLLTQHGEFRCRPEHYKGNLAAQRRTKKNVCKAKRFLTLRVKKERRGQWPEGTLHGQRWR